MISHKHKCIFVHVPKAAGISIEEIFLDDLNLNFQNRMALLLGKNTNKSLGPPFVSHLTSSEYITQHFITQKQFETYFTFGWVRNPYDRVYSFYKYLGYKSLMSFEKFVINYMPNLINDKNIKYFLQPMWNYLSIDGKIAVKYVGKLENIESDILEVFKNSKIERRNIPHSNNSKEISLREKTKRIFRILKKSPLAFRHCLVSKKSKKKEWTDEMKNVIYTIYKVDFLNFNYDK
ncbi:sulfotransferase family 2 domain-containing protein [Patiriisocius hiemis]|uniref:Sulfotransferase family 2 domain-containing protein n=1 Tax=Patiriisocius hiemis TaxID=3075604 RepID=A0ABU2YEN9_9FLAO|nr:sulfotransferase family 2 domain-containing protein [Constantimarinum sp. W242]MDT0556638.1 sulfotransferase family 2 domain-containing protein [Constantimarinum sp. W242]